MEPWLVIAIVGVLIVGAFIALSNRVGSTPMFYATYESVMKRSGSPHESLRRAIGIFTRRKPFNVLTPADVDMLVVDVFAGLPDPTVLAQVFLTADRQSDASMLKDRTKMDGFADYVLSQRGYRRVSVKGFWAGVKEQYLQVPEEQVRQYGGEQGDLYALCWFDASNPGNPNYVITHKRVWDRLDELLNEDFPDDDEMQSRRLRQVLGDAG